jgi:hypothetical protein
MAGVLVPGDSVIVRADSDDGAGDNQKAGRPKSNVGQNKQARDAVRDYERQTGRKLSRCQLRQAHDEFGRHPNPRYADLIDILKDTFGD